jgi:hypothetical protein
LSYFNSFFSIRFQELCGASNIDITKQSIYSVLDPSIASEAYSSLKSICQGFGRGDSQLVEYRSELSPDVLFRRYTQVF